MAYTWTNSVGLVQNSLGLYKFATQSDIIVLLAADGNDFSRAYVDISVWKTNENEKEEDYDEINADL